MNEKFERYRRELSEAQLSAFGALCFHRAANTAQAYAALSRAPSLAQEAVAEAAVIRAADRLGEDWDTERLARAVVEEIEGPGCMPGLISVRGQRGDFFVFECNIYQERGEPFTLKNLLAPVHYGLSSDPEYYFENVRGREVDVLFNCFHVTKLGLEFCASVFPERMEELRRAG